MIKVLLDKSTFHSCALVLLNKSFAMLVPLRLIAQFGVMQNGQGKNVVKSNDGKLIPIKKK